MKLSRRHFLTSGLAGFAAASLTGMIIDNRSFAAEKKASNHFIPTVLHQTELFHPHEDPDDHYDLAVLFALACSGDIDLAGILLDYPVTSRHAGDSAIISVAQMNRLCGLAVPAVVGTKFKQKTPDDQLVHASKNETAAIRFIHKILRESKTPVRFKCGSSAPDIAVAALRDPELFRKKCDAVYVNCGSAFPNPTRPEEQEYNVSINRAGQAALFNHLPCQVNWFPCWNQTLDWKSGEYGTYFQVQNRDVLKGVSVGFRYYLHYMYSKSNDFQWMRKMEVGPTEEQWNAILSGQRALWATPSLLMIAGKVVTRDGQLVSQNEIADRDALYRLDHIEVHADEKGNIKWKKSESPTRRKIFHVLDVEKYPSAMAVAVNTLFRSLGK